MSGAKLVFGATRHIGGPCAHALRRVMSPDLVRVASSRPEGAAALADSFQGSDVIQADMRDVQSMSAALQGVDGVFIVTPDFFDDRRGAEVLIEAARLANVRPHVVRIQAEIPGVGLGDLRGKLAGPIGRRGHLEARALLKASGLPCSFLAIVAYYMDDLLIHFAPTLRHGRLVVPYDRAMAWVDPADVGIAAARLLLAPPPRAPQVLPVNNGEDGISFAALAVRITNATGKLVSYVDDEDAFRTEIGGLLRQMTGSDDLTEYLLEDWRMEREHPHVYRARPTLGELLGRPPTTLAVWLAANAAALVA